MRDTEVRFMLLANETAAPVAGVLGIAYSPITIMEAKASSIMARAVIDALRVANIAILNICQIKSLRCPALFAF